MDGPAEGELAGVGAGLEDGGVGVVVGERGDGGEGGVHEGVEPEGVGWAGAGDVADEEGVP